MNMNIPMPIRKLDTLALPAFSLVKPVEDEDYHHVLHFIISGD